MTSVLGVDGGQSAVRLSHGLGGPIIELEGISRLESDTVLSAARAVIDGWHALGARPVKRVVLGLTTAPADRPAANRLCELVAGATHAPEIWLSDDAVTAHLGALEGQPGVSLVAGTGVACLALPPAGQPRMFGGYGFLLGDEGGAFWIGRAGLAAALRGHEGRGPGTSLIDSAVAAFGELDGLHVRLHDSKRPVDSIARFAPSVLEAATAGDDVAEGIAQRAVEELALVAETAAGWLDGLQVPVTLGGGLLASGSDLRRRLEGRLAYSPLPLSVEEPRGTPLDGALALGRQSDPGQYAPLVHIWHEVQA